MRIFYQLLFVSLVFVSSDAKVFGDVSGISSDSLWRLNKIYDMGNSDPVIKNWIDRRMTDVIKDPLDAEMDSILGSSPVAAELRPGVVQQVKDGIAQSYRAHLGNAAQALPGKDGQYQFLYELVQEAALKLNFQRDARTKIKVFVLSDPNQNAYTYSSGDEIHVVVFEGLLQNMARDEYQVDGITYYKDIGELRQVIGHELFHIKGKHIENQTMIFAIFFAVGENVIPTEFDGGLESSKDAAQLAALRSAQLDSILGKMAESLFPHAQGELQRKIIQQSLPGIKDQIRKSAQLLKARVGQKSLERLAVRLFKAARGVESDSEAAFDMKAFKQLQEDLKRLSRSQETSCDNAGYIVNGDHKSSVLSYARLAGGKGVKYEAIERQIRILHELINGEQSGDPYAQPGRSHPETLFRAAQFDMFRNTDAYRIFSNPFRRALYDYLSLSKTIMDLEHRVRSREVMEISQRGNLNLNRESLIAMAKNLSRWLENQLIAELVANSPKAKGQSPSIPLFTEFVKAMKRVLYRDGDEREVVEAHELRDEMGKAKRLVQDLVVRIEKEISHPLYKAKLIEMLHQLVPPEAANEFELNELSALISACHSVSPEPTDAAANGG